MNLSVYYLESCIPEIPSQGTVGASGDLAPLAHLAAGRLNKKNLNTCNETICLYH